MDIPKVPEVELVQRTQELYDALGSGNQVTWKMYVADMMIERRKNEDLLWKKIRRCSEFWIERGVCAAEF